jgi:hypothetical protein
MQLLPPKQRAVLVLRDVLPSTARCSAREQSLARAHHPADARAEAALMRQFREPWDDVDIDGIVALLTADALLTVPHEGVRIAGAEAIGAFSAYGLMVFAVEGEKIAGITDFPRRPDLFSRLGLPVELAR